MVFSKYFFSPRSEAQFISGIKCFQDFFLPMSQTEKKSSNADRNPPPPKKKPTSS